MAFIFLFAFTFERFYTFQIDECSKIIKHTIIHKVLMIIIMFKVRKNDIDDIDYDDFIINTKA